MKSTGYFIRRRVLQFLHTISTPSGVNRKSSLPSSLQRIGLDSGVDLSVIIKILDCLCKTATLLCSRISHAGYLLVVVAQFAHYLPFLINQNLNIIISTTRLFNLPRCVTEPKDIAAFNPLINLPWCKKHNQTLSYRPHRYDGYELLIVWLYDRSHSGQTTTIVTVSICPD